MNAVRYNSEMNLKDLLKLILQLCDTFMKTTTGDFASKKPNYLQINNFDRSMKRDAQFRRVSKQISFVDNLYFCRFKIITSETRLQEEKKFMKLKDLSSIMENRRKSKPKISLKNQEKKRKIELTPNLP